MIYDEYKKNICQWLLPNILIDDNKLMIMMTRENGKNFTAFGQRSM